MKRLKKINVIKQADFNFFCVRTTTPKLQNLTLCNIHQPQCTCKYPGKSTICFYLGVLLKYGHIYDWDIRLQEVAIFCTSNQKMLQYIDVESKLKVRGGGLALSKILTRQKSKKRTKTKNSVSSYPHDSNSGVRFK